MIKHIYSNPTEVARAVAEDVFVRMSESSPLHIAISGGSTPKLLFELLAGEEFRSRINWSMIYLYWVDERCVPPTDLESNYRMTREALLDRVAIPERQIHRIYGEVNPEEEARRYTELVEANLPQRNGLPQFDVVLLGMGEDGHTSSIFPHRMDLLTEQTPYVATTHTSGQNRIALTGATILNAKRLLLHATGERKMELVDQIERAEAIADTYPITYIIRQAPTLEWYTSR